MRFLLSVGYFLTFFTLVLPLRRRVSAYDEVFLVLPEGTPKIVGGTEASPHQYKSIMSSNFGCGGTLIAPTWVLTAAHCKRKYPKSSDVFTAGDHNKHISEGTEQQVQIKRWVVHENYKDGNINANDIALVEVDPPIEMTEYVDTAFLPSEGYTASGYAVVAGWGRLKFGKFEPGSPTLQHVRLPLLPLDECRSKYEFTAAQLPDGMQSLCTLHPGGGKDSCQGDSGGPMYAEDTSLPQGKRLLIGVVSWGIKCAEAEHPGVYVNVSHFIPWIENVVGKGVLKLHEQPRESVESNEDGDGNYSDYDDYDNDDNYSEEYDYDRK